MMLEARGLSRSFGGLFAVEHVDLSVEEREIHCLIGPNGAGKSTLFKLILGTYAPSAGQVIFRDVDVTRMPSFRRVNLGMSIKMQSPSIFKALSVRQNLHIAMQHHVRPSDIHREEDRLLALLGLSPEAAKPAGELSHGQQQWLEIGMALAIKPALLLLDEPTAGLSVDETHRTGELVKQLNESGITILVVEHDMAFVRQIATRVTVLHLGKVLTAGGIDEVTANPQVREVYLGVPHANR